MENPPSETFESIHRKYEEEVYTFLHSRLKDEEAAQDLTVAVFIAAYRAWDKFQKNNSIPVREWLLSIALLVYDSDRSRKRSEKQIRSHIYLIE